jgi:hypothetical protein
MVGEPAVGRVRFDAVWSHMRREHVRASVAPPPCGPVSAREFVSMKDRTGRQRLRATERPAHSAKGYHSNTMDTRAGNDTLTDRSPATPSAATKMAVESQPANLPRLGCVLVLAC